YERVILPALDRFRPDVVIASAGFDAYVEDPLAGLCVTVPAFAQLAGKLRDAAGGRLLALLEGGYHLAGLSASFAAMLAVLLGEPPLRADPVETGPWDEAIAPAEERNLLLAERSLAELPPPRP